MFPNTASGTATPAGSCAQYTDAATPHAKKPSTILISSTICPRRLEASSRSTPLASVIKALAPISRSPKPARAAMQVWRWCCAYW